MSPFAPLESSLAQALTDGFDMLTGLLLGCALAAGLRLSQLRWSWALVPLVVALAFPALLGGGSLTLSVALAAAAARGLALHRRDLRAGADVARAAAARVGPGEALARGVRAVERRCLSTGGAVVYFALHADQWPLLAPMLAGAIVEDLLRTAQALAARGEQAASVVVLDEFSALGAARVAGAFARARAAGFNLILATQELADLRLPGEERLIDRVQGNLSALIAHRQTVPDSIDWVVRSAGRRGAWQTSHDSRGGWRATRGSEARLDPEELRALAPGRAVVIELSERPAARVAAMHAP